MQWLKCCDIEENIKSKMYIKYNTTVDYVIAQCPLCGKEKTFVNLTRLNHKELESKAKKLFTEPATV